MQKIIFVAVVIMVRYTAFSQTPQFNPKIFEAKKIYLYGYDFSHFKFIDKKSRPADLVKDCLNGWVTFVNEKRGSERVLKKLLDKDEVVINYNPTQSRYSKISMEDKMGVAPSYVNKDSIQDYINTYAFPEKAGIGLIVFVDCFYKPDKLAAMTFVFFDLSDKKVLSIATAESNNADGHGLVNCWGVGMNETIAAYSHIYGKAQKAYNKSIKQ